MNRRTFLKGTLGASAVMTVRPLTKLGLTWPAGAEDRPAAYEVGEQISRDAFVLDDDMKQHHLLAICEEQAVNMLYLFGGGAPHRDDKLGGFWCGDSFEDMQIMRFVSEKYEYSGLNIIPVACAPVYSTKYYGLPDRVLLDEPDDSEAFQDAAVQFIKSTIKLADSRLLPVKPYYDLRLRLLFNSDENRAPGAGYGKIADWQGKFRANDETQTYGVPTIWLLDSKGVVLEKPFHGNIYHSDPYEIKYTIVDVDRALQKYL